MNTDFRETLLNPVHEGSSGATANIRYFDGFGGFRSLFVF